MDIVIKTSENMSAEIVSELRQDPRVAFVEPDQRVYALGQTIPVGVDRVDGDVSQAVSGDGSGAVDADIAILDTGIDLDPSRSECLPRKNVCTRHLFSRRRQRAWDSCGWNNCCKR